MVVNGASTGYIEPIDKRTCFLRNTDAIETVELCQRSVKIDALQTEHSIMQMQAMDYMQKVKPNLLAVLTKTLSLDHFRS